MTHYVESTKIEHALEALIENGMEGLADTVSVPVNEAMKVERSRVPGADPWQRTSSRKGHANGYKERLFRTA